MSAPVAAAAPAAAPSAAPAAPANGAPKGATETPAVDPKPNAAPAEPKVEQPWKVKRKLKLNGQEIEREYDDRRLQILEHTASRQSDIDARERALADRIRKLTEDPDSLFQEVGFDVNAYLAQQAARAEEMKKLSPEQQRIRELEDTLSKRELAEKRAAEQAEVQRKQREDTEFVQSNAKLYGDAMAAAGIKKGEPGAASFLSHMATVRHMAHVNGEPDMTADQLVAHTERFENRLFTDMLARKVANEGWRGRNGEGMQTLAKTVLSSLAKLEGDALLSWIGSDNAKAVVKALHAKTRSSPVPIVQDTPRAESPAAPTPAKGPTTWDEAAERFNF